MYKSYGNGCGGKNIPLHNCPDSAGFFLVFFFLKQTQPQSICCNSRWILAEIFFPDIVICWDINNISTVKQNCICSLYFYLCKSEGQISASVNWSNTSAFLGERELCSSLFLFNFCLLFVFALWFGSIRGERLPSGISVMRLNEPQLEKSWKISIRLVFSTGWFQRRQLPFSWKVSLSWKISNRQTSGMKTKIFPCKMVPSFLRWVGSRMLMFLYGPHWLAEGQPRDTPMQKTSPTFHWFWVKMDQLWVQNIK